jgi:hypothetical protein
VNSTERHEGIEEQQRLADLRRQHLLWLREGYDGHRRRSGITTMHRLRERRRRRLVRRSMRLWVWRYDGEELAA